MNIIKKINSHFLQTSESHFLTNLDKRTKFLNRKKGFFYRPSKRQNFTDFRRDRKLYSRRNNFSI